MARARRRATSLHEQLVAPRIRDAVAVVAIASPAVMPDFEEHAVKLARMRAEARDNRKFLATLERHFRNVTHWRDAARRGIFRVRIRKRRLFRVERHARWLSVHGD